MKTGGSTAAQGDECVEGSVWGAGGEVCFVWVMMGTVATESGIRPLQWSVGVTRSCIKAFWRLVALYGALFCSSHISHYRPVITEARHLHEQNMGCLT